MSRDVEILDEQVERFASARGIQLDEPMRYLLRDAMLWMADDAATVAGTHANEAAPDMERRWTKAEASAVRSLHDFADIQRAWIDRVRTALDLPERQHKQIEDSIKAALSRK